MKIRTYIESTDHQQLKNCMIALQDFERGFDPRMPRGESIADQYLLDTFDECEKYAGKVFVLERDGSIGGYITVYSKYVSPDIDDGPREFGLIGDLFVKEKYRGEGMGKTLLDHAEQYLKEAGVSELKIGVLAANTAAKALYLAHGFKEFSITLEKRL